MEPDVRDAIIEAMMDYQDKTGIPITRLLHFAGLASSKYYDWRKRYGMANHHHRQIPRSHWLLDKEKECIVRYARQNREDGYRRLTYRMIDEDIAYASPSSVYRVLKEHGLLQRFYPVKTRSKGRGYAQPEGPHQDWHIDISYINVLSTFLFLIAIIEGYSRYIVHHELRASMEEKDVELVIQRGLEKFPEAKPKIISDHGSQFIAKGFRRFLRYVGLQHALISVGYPQSNGKIERFYRTAKTECIRRTSFLSIEDARKQIDSFIQYYNHQRLHSAICYVTPYDMLSGHSEEVLKTRDEKLKEARKRRIEIFNNSTLTQQVVFSNSR